MRIVLFLLALLPMASVVLGQAPATNDSTPAPTNIPGAEYPRITPDLRVIFRIRAPNAQKVEFDLGRPYAAEPAFAAFEQDLLQDVIPTIEMRYSVRADRKHQALAGLSMGAGQSLNFGLSHLDEFGWVGSFSAAPNTKHPAELVPDPAAARKKLKLLWISGGSKDGLLSISQGVHAYLKEKNVPHVWNVDGHGHDPTTWRNNLYYLLQRLFR